MFNLNNDVNTEMMKRIVCILMLLGVTSWAFAQGTRFLDNEPWAKVVEQAKKADKMIFVDCYTSWCGPCKTLATEIFPQEKVGDYMNERFVCVKYDMEKEEGLKFNELYPGEVKAYPTMLIIDNKGELVHKVVGSQPADDLIRAIEAGLQGNTIYTMIKEYEQGNREEAFVKKYLVALENANEKERYEQVARAYAAQFPIDSLLNPELWAIMGRFAVDDPYSKEYRFVVEHLDDFQKRGVDRYALESQLSNSMGFEVNMLFLGFCQPDGQDSLPSLRRRAEQLEVLLRQPVKGFPEARAELMVNQALFSGDVDELYQRFITLVDCGLVTRDYYMESIYRYLLNHLTDKERIEVCVEHAQALADEHTGWEKDMFDKLVTVGKEKLANLK